MNKAEQPEASAPVHDWAPNFHWITSELAVGGSFAAVHVPHLAQRHRIAAVVDLRGEEKDDEEALRSHGIALLHLPTPDMCGVDARDLDVGVAFANHHLDAGRRVLVHCEHGIGRSATLALCVMVDRGWQPLDALLRMKDERALVSPSPEQFASWEAWLDRHRRVRQVDWSTPTFEQFAVVAYRHLATPG